MRTFIKKSDRLALEILWSLQAKPQTAVEYTAADLAFFRKPLTSESK